jgi:hypothetical protein
MEFAQDTIWSAIEYAESEGFPEDTAWEEARSVLKHAGFSVAEITEAFEKFHLTS